MIQIPFLFFLVACGVFSFKRLLRYLQYFQQDGYSTKRFLYWIVEQKAFDRRGSATLIFTIVLYYFFPDKALFIGGGLLLLWSFTEENPLKEGKIKLSLTPRAKRIFGTALFLFSLCQIGICFFDIYLFLISQIILIQITPLFLVFAVGLLSFDEKRRQRRFVREAVMRLKEVSPYVIGITGSYGKTSTKNALGNILQVSLGSTFWPRKGVNTEMGITREIRDFLKNEVRYAVIEMGAYHQGSIAKLCRLTPPQAGIITTIGVAHLDRFGDQNAIREAKSELAQAIPYNGILVCNGDNEGTRKIAQDFRKKTTLLYGFDNSKGDLDCWIKEYNSSERGALFVFCWKGKEYKGETWLAGKAALSNLAASFCMACALGASPELVIGALSHLKPVDNRLQIHKEQEITYLKDAYNSNPEGFSDALDVLSAFPTGRKILMTPGMIELASLEKELHYKIGEKAGKICDFAIVVGETNRESLTKGLLSGGMSKDHLIAVPDREGAFRELKGLLKPGDIVLIENDLPDLYSNSLKNRF